MFRHIRFPRLKDRFIKSFWARVDSSGGQDACWPWIPPYQVGLGYGRLKLPNGMLVLAHRLAYFLETGTDPQDWMVCHRCDNPRCCNPAHLFLGDHQTNMADMRAKGRARAPEQHGSANPQAKLSERDVGVIRSQIAAGHTNCDIAKRYSVTHQLISRIRRGEIWTHVS
ncbi:MAG: HNH endonuclease [Patescibacteria group bacterium]|nr:HNH endonuclease [Patescibacteria group bacterium]